MVLGTTRSYDIEPRLVVKLLKRAWCRGNIVSNARTLCRNLVKNLRRKGLIFFAFLRFLTILKALVLIATRTSDIERRTVEKLAMRAFELL